MGISSKNALLNQYVPDFCIHSPVSGHILIYDSRSKSFTNVPANSGNSGLIPPEELLWENEYNSGDIVTISDSLLTFKAVPANNGQALVPPAGLMWQNTYVPGNLAMVSDDSETFVAVTASDIIGIISLDDIIDVEVSCPLDDGMVLRFSGDCDDQIWKNSFLSYNDLIDLPDPIDGINLGSGEGVYVQNIDNVLEFKSLVSGDGISLSSDGNEITIENVSQGEVNYGSNVGPGEGIYSQKLGEELQFKTLVAGSNITLDSSGNYITISAQGTGGNDGESNTASNIGQGNGLYARKLGVDLQFKSIVAGSNIAITPGTEIITISSTGSGEINTASNVGGGTGIYLRKTNANLEFGTLVAGPNITITPSGNTITIGGTGGGGGDGESNTASNLGPGSQVFAQKEDVDLEFRTLVAGNDITLTQTANTIVIDSDAEGGEDNTASNLGSGQYLFAQKVDEDLQFKSLIAGTDISLTSSGNDITINSTADTVGEVNDGANLGTGQGLYTDKSNETLQFKSLVAGDNIILSSDGNEITITSTGGGQGGTGEANTASNLGNGEGVFAQKNGIDLELKSFKAGSGISLSSDGNEITVTSTVVGAGESNTASNLGTGAQVYAQKSGVDLQFRTVKGGDGITVLQDSTSVTINSDGVIGEANDGTNLGSGSQVFAKKSDVDLEFRSLVGGSNVSLTQTSNTITIDAADSTGEINTASNLSGGTGIFSQKVDEDLRFKSLVGGSNVGLVEGADTITINADVDTDGLVTSAANIGSGEGVFAQKTNDELQFKSLVAGSNVTLSSTGNQITISSSGGGGGDGEANDGVNLGNGAEVFAQKSGVDLEFKTVVAGNNITIDESADEITVNATLGPLGTPVAFESVRINYSPAGTVLPGDLGGVQDPSEGITSAIVDVPNHVRFEFAYNRPPTSIVYYGYKDLGAPGWGYKMVMPALGSAINEVWTGGESGNPAEDIRNMANGSYIRLQLNTGQTLGDSGQHAIVFFLF